MGARLVKWVRIASQNRSPGSSPASGKNLTGFNLTPTPIYTHTDIMGSVHEGLNKKNIYKNMLK